jgi:hypothetical protein
VLLAHIQELTSQLDAECQEKSGKCAYQFCESYLCSNAF